MGLTGDALSQYPLDKHYENCRQYLYHSMNWDEIRISIREKGTIGVDVTDTILLFSRLELDSNYRLICYMTSEYHGIYGSVLAVKKCDDWRPKCHTDKDCNQMNRLHIPECAVPAMEAIYNDGSGEGYLEAVLYALFLRALPYTCFEQNRWPLILNTIPDHFEETWDYYVLVADWNPRYSNRTVTVMERKIENGIGASNGKDRIYLTQFQFCSSVNDYLLANVIKTQKPINSNHITDGNRYSKIKRCCVFIQSSVLVAEEK